MLPPPLIIRPRLIKPPGAPRIIWPRAPRGLDFCLPMGSPDFVDIARGRRPTVTSTPGLMGSQRGGAFTTNGSGVLGYAYSTPPSVFSYEVMIFAGASPNAGGETIIGFNDSANGSGGTTDRSLYSSSSNYAFYVFNTLSSNLSSSNGNYVANRFTHLIGTIDTTGVKRLYENGALSATAVGGGTPVQYSGYLCVGRCNVPAFNSNFWSGAILLANMALVCWTPQEVAQRFADPFGFLDFPQDRALRIMGVGTAGASYSQTIAAVTTPSPALVRAMGKLIIGNTTPPPSLVRASSITRAINSTPAPAVVRQTATTKAVTTTPAPGISRSVDKSLTVSTTPTPTIIRAVAKALAVTCTAAGSVLKATGKTAAVSTTPASSLTAGQAFARTIAVTAAVVPAMIRSTSKGIAGSTTPRPSLQARATFRRVISTLASPVASLIATFIPPGTLTNGFRSLFARSWFPRKPR